MKNTRISVVAAIAVLGMSSVVNAGGDIASVEPAVEAPVAASKGGFDDAFKNGKISGDVTVTYEKRDQDVETGSYYDNSAYSVGSAELIFTTADYNNFSATLGFRGYTVLYEDDKDSTSGYGPNMGTGDASSRFFHINGGSIAVTTNAYIAYNTDKLHIKAGRQELETEWMDEHHDAVSIYANPTENLEAELIWSNRHNRMWARELFYGGTIDGVMGTINSEGGGLYKAGLTYKISPSLKVKAYALTAPDNYSVYGGRVTVDTKINDVGVGGFFHYMQTNEELAGNEDGELIDAKVYAEYAGFTTALGYIQTGKDGGWGSAYKGGENVDPFEEGDQLYPYVAIDARTPYITLSKSIGGLSLSGIYGVSKYRTVKNGPEYEKSEFCVWAGYDITDKLNLGAILTLNDADENDPYPSSDMTQASVTMVYKF